MSGIQELVSAFAGRGNLANDSYNREMARLTSAKSAQALMDKRVADAAMAKTKNAQFQNIPNLEGIDPLVAAIIQAGAGSDFSSAMTGMGKKGDNEVAALAQEIAKKFANDPSKTPEDAINILNASQGTMLGPGNVRTSAQAGADIDLTEAQTANQVAAAFAANELAHERQAKTNKVNQEIENLVNQDVPGLEVPDGDTLDLMFPNIIDEEGYDAENPDKIQFLQWLPNAAKTNPEYKNLMSAFAEFKKRKNLAPSPKELSSVGAPGNPKPTRAELYKPTDYSSLSDAEINALLQQRGIQ